MKHESNLLSLSSENFNHCVLASVVPVVVLFGAGWSGSADILVGILEELAQRFSGKVVFAKIDADESQEIATQFGIDCIPSMLFFKNGRVNDRVTGVMAKNELAGKVHALVDY